MWQRFDIIKLIIFYQIKIIYRTRVNIISQGEKYGLVQQKIKRGKSTVTTL